MPDLTLKNKQDVEDFVRGCTFYGTGGGGSPDVGVSLLLEDLAKIGEIHISDIAKVHDDSWVCAPGFMGSIAPRTNDTLARMADAGLTRRIGMADRLLVLAILELQSYAHVEIDVIVPIELGAVNTPAPIDAALSLGKQVVNGDFSGRAVPEFEQMTTYFANMPTHPTTYVDEWGNISIIKTAVNYRVAEALGKMISVAAFGLVGSAACLMRGSELKKVLIPNTLSECLAVGQTIRHAVTNGQDPADAVAEATKGWVLFRGRISKKEWIDRDGYLWGTVVIEGHEGFAGHRFKIFYKNENHITWFDDKPYVTSPDIIQLMQRDSGEPLTNTVIKEDDVVSVVGVRGRDPFRSPKGLEILGPKHFGYDIPYIPIEKVMDRGK